MNFLLNATNYTQKLPFDEAMTYGITNVLLGVGTVFAVLIALMIVLYLFKFFFHDLAVKSPKKKEPVQTSAPAEAPATVRYSADDEIVAVIAAAIAMAESESGGVKFRVVSFRKK